MFRRLWSHDKEDGSALIHFLEQKYLISFVAHRCGCQYTHRKTSFQWFSLGPEPINLPENLGLHLPWKLKKYLCKASPRLDYLKMEEGIIDGLQSWLNFSFSDICLYEYLPSCNVISFGLFTPDNTLFAHIFQQQNLRWFSTFLLPRQPDC